LHGSELRALARACRYSFIPNELGYCGAQDFSELFISFIRGPKEESVPEIKKALRTFIGEHSYIELIAEHHGIDEFCGEAIEAYWTGSPLLEGIPLEKVGLLFNTKFLSLPESIRNKKISSLPEQPLIHHSFHVLFTEFLTPKLPAIVQNLDKCIVGWGKVISNAGEEIELKGVELAAANGELVLREKIKKAKNPFSLNPEPGSFITVHWDNAIEEIGEAWLKQLKKYTQKNLELANSSR